MIGTTSTSFARSWGNSISTPHNTFNAYLVAITKASFVYDIPISQPTLKALNGQQMSYHQACGEIDSLADLSDNWDGYGAQPVDTNTRTRAKWFLSTVMKNVGVPQPDVEATANGGVALEWDYDDVYVAFEVDPYEDGDDPIENVRVCIGTTVEDEIEGPLIYLVSEADDAIMRLITRS